ncbi:MAG: FtsW/RodA/SpoVE family cell cycle protein, partial [Lachnospiraceae bacterium]|nr:FtsW/RodA/SpoVE family cell cycle protein [Lachnospiraceae bacterium]
ILREPDLSTSVVFLFTSLILLFSGGISWKNVAIFLGVAVPLSIFLIWYIQQPFQILFAEHQVERILTFFNPSEYMNSTYAQQYNALLAIGSGMLSGKDLSGAADVVKGSSYLSESENDFIFAVIGEKYGFIGCCIVIGLIIWIVLECMIIARDAQDLTGRLIATGIGSMIAFQSFVNMGVATSLLPNTGLPLPFVSYGLTSILTNYVSIGIVINVGLQRRRR